MTKKPTHNGINLKTLPTFTFTKVKTPTAFQAKSLWAA